MQYHFNCVSDTHGAVPPDASDNGITAWLHAGDVCDRGQEPPAFVRWAALRRVPVLVVRGNHDAGQGAWLEEGRLHDVSEEVVQVAPRLFVVGVGWSGMNFCCLPSEYALNEVCKRVISRARSKMAAGDHCVVLTHYPAWLPSVFSPEGTSPDAGYDCIRHLIEELNPLAAVQGHIHNLACSQGLYEHKGHRTVVAFPGPDGGQLAVDPEAATASFAPWLTEGVDSGTEKKRVGAQRDILKTPEFRTLAQMALATFPPNSLVLIGDLAVAHYANPPLTVDVDFLAKGSCGDLLEVAADLWAPWEVMLLSFPKSTIKHCVRIKSKQEPQIVLDLWACGSSGYLDSVVDRAVPVEVQPGLVVPIARAEDIIVLKELAGRDKDREDVAMMSHALGDTLDHVYIARTLDRLRQEQ
ncbi:MAG: metallophosphoesterase [Planctomycetota bacterium]